jgi:arginyl-tRNA--protein-N-Asp/Glu arginylyltransferase
MTSWCRKCKRDNLTKRNLRRSERYVTQVTCRDCKAQYLIDFDASVGWVETEEKKKKVLTDEERQITLPIDGL